MTPPPNRLEAWQAAALIARRELRAVDLMQACLERIAEREPQVHAFAHLAAEAALDRARDLDAAPVRGPLHGLPFGVKDLIDTHDMPTGYGSPIYAGHRPRADAAVVALARAAGAIPLGKTVSTELANTTPGPTCNPHGLAHTPGGSSSGSVAAVADCMLPLALGTQTAGSIIRPAAYCGVVGFKPSFGRVPRAGVKPIAESLDTVGSFGRSVRDAALFGAVLLGDQRLLDLPEPGALRIGFARGPDWRLADADVVAAWEHAVAVLAPLAACADAQLPADFGDVAAVQLAIQAAETAQAFSDERLRHADRLSAPLRGFLEAGLAVDADAVAAHQARAARWRAGFDALFAHHDALLAPSATGCAPQGLASTGDPVFCRPWSLLGLPCVHLPFGRGRNGLPVGLQLVGRHGSDHRLLACAQWLQPRLAG